MKGCNVLLVDDEQEFASTLAERLGLRGIEVRVAENGAEALERIAERVPDIVVLDLMMPGMSGSAVLERIKAEHPEIRVILVTGMGSLENGLKGVHGAVDYLMKPLEIETLLKTIGEALSANTCEVD
jgi:DNA-binding NtrC family response regulator